MVRKLSLGSACLALAILPTPSIGASIGYNLRLTVPMYCSVRLTSPGMAQGGEGALPLGRFREYCNAPGGYQLVVRYMPGTLQGATILAGEDRVVLDGSGQTTISQSNGPRIREREISAAPGEQGFDTDRIEFLVIPG
jgi:hypothetical protein